MRGRVLFWAIILIFSLLSCIQANTPSGVNITPLPSTAIKTQSPSPTNSSLSTLPPLPTPSPYPTLNSNEAERLVDTIVTTDKICVFPCWAGIIPGKTKWSEKQSFFESFAKVQKHSPLQPSGYTIQVSGSNMLPDQQNLWFSTIYLNNNDVVLYVEGNSRKISIDQLLQKYGKPDGINLFILGVLPADKFEEVRFVFTYKVEGFLMIYDGKTTNQQFLEICPLHISEDPGFWIWDPADASAFTVITEDKAYSSFWDYWPQYQEIAVATKGKVTVDSFYETYSNSANANVCFQVLSPSFP